LWIWLAFIGKESYNKLEIKIDKGDIMVKVKLDILAALDGSWDIIRKNKGVLGILLLLNLTLSIANNFLVVIPDYDSATVPAFSMDMIKMQVQTLFFLFLFFMINNMVLLIVKHDKNETDYHFSELPWPAFVKVFVGIGAIILLILAMIIPNIIIGVLIAALGPVGIVFFIAYMIAIVYIMFCMSFIVESVVFEDVGPIMAIKNSFKLVSHNFFRLLLFYLVTGGVIMVIAFSTMNLDLVRYLIMPIQSALGIFTTIISGLIYSQCLVKKDVQVEIFSEID